MSLPNIDASDVYQIIDEKWSISNVNYLGKGGQKIVFECLVDTTPYVLKFLKVDLQGDEKNSGFSTNDLKSEVLSRVAREIEIMKKCDTRSLVKLGPIEMNHIEYNGEFLIYFSEELIDGTDLSKIISQRTLSQTETLQLTIDITSAINELWNIGMVHRDIKPQNIMCRTDGTFTLLDAGIAFDTNGEALTQTLLVIGTPIYMSPEQLSNKKASLDFRSDLFLLGIVLYHSVTGTHPFFKPGITSLKLQSNIINATCEPPITITSDLNVKLNKLIMRLLSKHAHMRFRTCELLIKKAREIQGEL